jgi:Cu/Zn superoxide dismutase
MNAIRFSIAAFALAALAFTGAPAMAASGPLTVTMGAQNGSGEDGSATLTQTPDGVQVVVTVKNAPAAAQPAHIHPGTCANLTPAPKYPLTSLANGTSTTLVKGVTIDQLLASPFAINVHKSTSDLGTYVSCGNITGS